MTTLNDPIACKQFNIQWLCKTVCRIRSEQIICTNKKKIVTQMGKWIIQKWYTDLLLMNSYKMLIQEHETVDTDS